MKRLAVVFLLAVLGGWPAAAATDPADDTGKLAQPQLTAEPVFRAFNLLGNWAVSCGEPASPENPHVGVTAPGGGLIVETHDVGPEFAVNLYHIIAARRLDRDRVEARALFRPGLEGEEQQTLVMRVGKNTRRTVFNRSEDGVRVKDGVALMSGMKTPVLRKCG